MIFHLQSLTRHLLLLCGTVGFCAMTACQSEEQPIEPPEAEETEDEAEDEGPAPAPAPAPLTPPE